VPQPDDLPGLPHPRETTVFFGHAAAESALLDAYRSGRLAHAWLIGGPAGVGKATLAYRMARFVLAHPDPNSAAVQSAQSLVVEASHPVASLVAARSHPDLVALERTADEEGKVPKFIPADSARRLPGFFAHTAAAGGWRVAVVDATDELNEQSAHALLKIVEEPPARALLLLVSHAPARVLATIRSRCRRLMLGRLAAADVARAVAVACGRNDDASEVIAASAAAQGSVARAATMLSGTDAAVRARTGELLAGLPSLDWRGMHALGDALGRTEETALAAFADVVRDWLSARLGNGSGDLDRLAQLAEVWEKVDRAVRDVEVFNLERKPLVFTTFALLAEATRR
jgi:DNA polymerase-3 subunit delta'